MSQGLTKSFELKQINIPKITPKETMNIMIASFSEAGWTDSEIKSIMNQMRKDKLGYSYRFEHDGNPYLLFELIKNSIKEYHFFNLNSPDRSTEILNNSSNPTFVFSMIFNLIYRDIKNGDFKYGIRILSDERRNKLYRKIFDKVNEKYNLGLVLKDIKKDSFVMDIPRPKSFKESIRLK